MLLNSSSIQTLLSVPEPPRISCFYRFQNIFWNPTSYRLRTIPPVGNRTQPRRTNRCLIVTCKSIRCFCRIASTFAIHICSVFRHTLMLSVLPAQGQPNNITRPTEPVLVSLQPSGQRGYIKSRGPLCWRRCLARFFRAIRTAAPCTERKRVRLGMIYPADHSCSIYPILPFWNRDKCSNGSIRRPRYRPHPSLTR